MLVGDYASNLDNETTKYILKYLEKNPLISKWL